MNSTKFLFLFALAILILSFSIFSSDNAQAPSRNELSPISGIEGTEVKKISIQSGENSAELALLNDKWVVVNRENYKAEPSKISSLLLKLLSTQSVQMIPSSADGMKQLGLEEGAEKQGITTKVTLGNDNTSAGILLGNLRPSNPENPVGGPAQYIRQLKSEQVMILKNPIVAQARPEEWISTELINVLNKSFYKFEQYINGSLAYVIKTTEVLTGETQLELDAPVPAGKELRKAIVTQVASGLENLGISDVLAANSEAIARLNFDREVKYYLINALVYSIQTAETQENPKSTYAKISVSFDPNLVEEIKAIDLANKQKAASSSSTSSSESSFSSNSSATELQFSNAEEASKLSEAHKNWVYKLPEYAAGKFRKNLEDYYETKQEEKK